MAIPMKYPIRRIEGWLHDVLDIRAREDTSMCKVPTNGDQTELLLPMLTYSRQRQISASIGLLEAMAESTKG